MDMEEEEHDVASSGAQSSTQGMISLKQLLAKIPKLDADCKKWIQLMEAQISIVLGIVDVALAKVLGGPVSVRVTDRALTHLLMGTLVKVHAVAIWKGESKVVEMIEQLKGSKSQQLGTELVQLQVMVMQMHRLQLRQRRLKLKRGCSCICSCTCQLL